MHESEELLKRQRELTDLLKKAGRAYYQESREIMPNIEYDRLYDELLALERETGTTFSDSPTVNVGYEIVSELPKERHASPMLSLDKTKEVPVLADWLGEKEGLLSWKLDGLTVVLTYSGGKLAKAVTRGNGEVGEVITGNARAFENLPLTIPFSGELVLRGEAVIRYSDFEEINASLGEEAGKYKNPRNLCSGSVRQLNSAVTAQRHVRFYAFTLVRAEGQEFDNSRAGQLAWLSAQGFETVFFRRVTRETVAEAVAAFSREITVNDLPSDGLVLTYDDIAYGVSLGRTAKFPRDSVAFKWGDEREETTLREIEWNASRTGLINPVAVFDPVELEGTTVTRASVHNVSIVESLKLAPGDRITVYKANMIIPQIDENLTGSGPEAPPSACPVCGAGTVIAQSADVKTLICPNPDCPAKKLKSFDLFVSRDALNIDGLSEATLEKLVDRGIVRSIPDLFRLEGQKEAIVNLPGFGEKSWERLVRSAETARKTTLPRLIYGLGIAGIGLANARQLCRAFGDDPQRLMDASREELLAVDGIGAVLADGVLAYFASEENRALIRELLQIVRLEKTAAQRGDGLAGKTFVITGSLVQFANRKELQQEIEALGGKVAGSVSSATDYLINNDSTSGSTKNKKAKELGIPVITEEEAVALLKEAGNGGNEI